MDDATFDPEDYCHECGERHFGDCGPDPDGTFPCEHGHYGCATTLRGRCSAEMRASDTFGLDDPFYAGYEPSDNQGGMRRIPNAHVWQYGRFTGAMTCERCGLLPLDQDDIETECPGTRPA